MLRKNTSCMTRRTVAWLHSFTTNNKNTIKNRRGLLPVEEHRTPSRAVGQHCKQPQNLANNQLLLSYLGGGLYIYIYIYIMLFILYILWAHPAIWQVVDKANVEIRQATSAFPALKTQYGVRAIPPALHPSRAAGGPVLWGKMTWNLSGLCRKRDCGPKTGRYHFRPSLGLPYAWP